MQQIKPIEPQRDREGYWTHPDVPGIETSEQFNVWQAEQGFECSVVMLDSDDGVGSEDACQRYFEEGDTDILAWQPSKPEGDGWFIVSIHDTGEGPACLWIRYPTEEQKREAEERKMLDALKENFLEKHRACEKAAYEYFSACPVGDERTFMGEVYQRIRLATSKSGKGA